MDVHKSSLLAIFEPKQRIEVPLFQRQYVWNEEQHWLPLWEDIERKFTESLNGRTDAPNHFLGAMVLDQKQTPTGHVVVRQVIDGQQRLTTLQIFLSAFRDFCREYECDALASECDKFLFNTGMMSDKDVDQFKVWPTQLDRNQFTSVISSGSRLELLKRFPKKLKSRSKKPEPRAPMVEAYMFFFNKIKEFFFGEDDDSPLACEYPLLTRVDQCFQTLRNSLMVVIIDLQKEDDPQVIFETLNARGEPLLPADLLKNYIFFRANRDKINIEELYNKYWSHFDDEFWRQEVKQGRLNRPRSDLFMQHFLSSRQGQDIPIKHLYIEYRHWIETKCPFADVETELSELARQGIDFKRIIAPDKDDIIFPLYAFLEAFDIRSVYPLLLSILNDETSDDELELICQILESYLLRRAVCNLGTKNYNRIFLSLTRHIQNTKSKASSLKELLLTLSGESSLWPDDATFKESWLFKPLFGPLNSPKLVHIYSRLNQTYMSSKSEGVTFVEPPTIEHIMPRKWITDWPLPDGSKGMDLFDLLNADSDDNRATATRQRDTAVNTLGNLTLLSRALNSAQSNLPWRLKRPEIMKHSLLPINLSLSEINTWDEESIRIRASNLFDRAINIWSR